LQQPDVIEAMLRPGFYPEPPAEIGHKETHISHLFFAGDLVFKVKKAVRFAFLDFSTLARRRFYLNEELRLNRRLAPSVYIRVVPISRDEKGWRLGGGGEPAEYVLVMRRLPEKRMLPLLLETEQVTRELMRELAAAVARFHIEARSCEALEPGLYPARVNKQWNDNLRELEPLVDQSISREQLDAVIAFGADFLARNSELLRQRAEQGWIRDIHGDLHCEHVCFAPQGVQIFDCIEFDPDLRCCDVAAEIAFLAMDLEVRGGAAWIDPFREHYRELLDDPAQTTLLPFFKCQRALVRGKVHALRGPAGLNEAARYFRYAAGLTWHAHQPFVVVICGLTGSGKSTLARELAHRLALPVINSDVVRKAMAGVTGSRKVPYDKDLYSAAMTAKTYARLVQEAEKLIHRRTGVIIDGTFTQREQRAEILRLAGKHKIPLVFIHCTADADTTGKRLATRAAAGTDISDGRWEIYLKQQARDEPLDDVRPTARLELDSGEPMERLVSRCEAFLRRCLIIKTSNDF
jgi:aminoglycoside phosphotransferase family enzyme/predicted kinase